MSFNIWKIGNTIAVAHRSEFGCAQMQDSARTGTMPTMHENYRKSLCPRKDNNWLTFPKFFLPRIFALAQPTHDNPGPCDVKLSFWSHITSRSRHFPSPLCSCHCKSDYRKICSHQYLDRVASLLMSSSRLLPRIHGCLSPG